MSSEPPPQNPEWTIQEERLQYGAEKKKQRDTARLIWASKPRKEPSPKDLDFQTAEIVIPTKAAGDLRSFFDTEKMEIVHQFSIPYINIMGHLVPYYPDFIVKTKDAMYIIETKSTKDASTDTDTKRKAIAASERCFQISRIKNIPATVQPRAWNYVLLPQNIFDEMEGSGLRSLIDRCEANLALLKMRKQ